MTGAAGAGVEGVDSGLAEMGGGAGGDLGCDGASLSHAASNVSARPAQSR